MAAKYELLPDENIVCECKGAAFSNKSMGDLTLTNKRLIFVRKGMLLGRAKGVDYYELDKIAVTDGEPSVECVKLKLSGGLLRIGFQDKTVDFQIEMGNRKAAVQWTNAIYRVLTGHDAPASKTGQE